MRNHWRLLIVAGLTLAAIAYCSSQAGCPRYSKSVNVEGKSYCFDDGHYNVDGE